MRRSWTRILPFAGLACVGSPRVAGQAERFAAVGVEGVAVLIEPASVALGVTELVTPGEVSLWAPELPRINLRLGTIPERGAVTDTANVCWPALTPDQSVTCRATAVRVERTAQRVTIVVRDADVVRAWWTARPERVNVLRRAPLEVDRYSDLVPIFRK